MITRTLTHNSMLSSILSLTIFSFSSEIAFSVAYSSAKQFWSFLSSSSIAKKERKNNCFSRIHLTSHRCSFCVILDTTSITKHCAPRFIFIILSASLLRTDVHFGSFCHNIEFARFRTEDHSCSVLVHLSFAPQFILGHFVTISNSKHCASRFIFVH